MSSTEHSRVIWMTHDQRTATWYLLHDTLCEQPDVDGREHLAAVLAELSRVQARQRISGRLVRNHVSGMRLPHDALPVRMTDTQALAVLKCGVSDRSLVRMLQPGPVRGGRR